MAGPTGEEKCGLVGEKADRRNFSVGKSERRGKTSDQRRERYERKSG